MIERLLIPLLAGIFLALLWFGPVFVVAAHSAPRDPFRDFARAVTTALAPEPPRNAPVKTARKYSDPIRGTVRASWYGGGEKLNRHVANGEVFNPSAMTCAHRTLPFNTMVRVTRGDRSAICRVNDRGPAKWTGRSIDLSRATAAAIGLIGPGHGRVTIEVIR